MKTKVKVEVEKPVFCVVQQTARGDQPRYRTVIHRNVKNKTITIDKMEYTLVESEELKPGINAHAFRTFCDKGNAQHAIEHGIKTKAQEAEREKTWKANAAKREAERKAARKARYEERRQGIKQAAPILRDIAIRRRMMDEVESGQQAIPKSLRPAIS